MPLAAEHDARDDSRGNRLREGRAQSRQWPRVMCLKTKDAAQRSQGKAALAKSLTQRRKA